MPFAPWTSRALDPVAVPMPARRAVAVLRARLEDAAGRVLQRNFTSFVVGRGRLAPRRDGGRRRAAAPRAARGPGAPRSAARGACGPGTRWTGASRTGPGAGFFEYRLAWPKGLRAEDVTGASFLAELGAKELFGKDRVGGGRGRGGLHAREGHARPRPQPQRLPDDGRRRGTRARCGSSSTASPPASSTCPTIPPTTGASCPGTRRSGTGSSGRGGLLRDARLRDRARRGPAGGRRRRARS